MKQSVYRAMILLLGSPMSSFQKRTETALCRNLIFYYCSLFIGFQKLFCVCVSGSCFFLNSVPKRERWNLNSLRRNKKCRQAPLIPPIESFKKGLSANLVFNFCLFSKCQTARRVYLSAFLVLLVDIAVVWVSIRVSFDHG